MNDISSTTSPNTLRQRRPLHTGRPDRCDRVALVLQGGGALGAYQAGVYQAMHEANIMPDWVAGVSIGAINAANMRRAHALVESGKSRGKIVLEGF